MTKYSTNKLKNQWIQSLCLIISVGLLTTQGLTGINPESKNTEKTDGEDKIFLTTGIMIRKEITLSATVDAVWEAWTTEKGVTRFFAPAARVELAIGGKFEMLFDPTAPERLQGSEGCRILSFIPHEMISFTWNAPPSMPKVRKEKTWVVLFFRESEEGKTTLSLVHLGWQPGDEWQNALRYFDHAWETVLARLQYSFQQGPINWKSPYTPEYKKHE